MASAFCCSSISPYRPCYLDHEDKFKAFISWACFQTTSTSSADGSLVSTAPYAVQLVRQVNYGPQESIRYFVPVDNNSRFHEVKEDDLLASNFEKLNSYKNFKCQEHNKFFEINLYKKNPINKHHWRSNLARPSRDIDLGLRRKDIEADPSENQKTSAGQDVKNDLENDIGEESHDPGSEKGSEGSLSRMHRGRFRSYDYDDDYDDDFGDDGYEPMKDLTACDKECGYCGNCDY